MDIPSAYNSPANSHPATPQPSQPGTTNPSPSTSVSVPTSLANRPQLPPHSLSRRRVPASGLSDRTRRALDGIRTFLGSKSCYDILPESFRLIVLDNKLAITKSLQALVTNGVVSAPLYDSTTQKFSGMFTLADIVHLIQYYYLTANEYDNVVAEVEAFQLGSLRKIEQAIDVPPPPTISVHPDQPLSDACAALVRTHARRLPLVDKDDQTGKETIVSVLTQYRVLKFIAINCAHDCARLDQSIGSLGIGTYAAWYEPPPHKSPTSTSPHAAGTASPEPLSPVSPLSDTKSPESLLSGGADSLPDDPTTSSKTTTTTTTKPSEDGEGGGGTDSPRSGTDTPTTARRSEFPLSVYPEKEYQQDHSSPTSMGVSDRFFPLSTATMKTSVFDVVHIFSERGISAVPIVDEDGIVLNMYETVDIVDLVRQNAYQVLDSTIEDAINQRSPDFTGVMTCTPSDTLSSVLTYVRERRCHRFVIVEPEDVPAGVDGRPARKKGSLVGILSLSDMLRFLVGHENLKGMEVPGLGVHGLRGVSSSHDPAHPSQSSGLETDLEFLTDAASSTGGSKMGSRRGSEATDSSFSLDGHLSGPSNLVAQPSASVPGPKEGGLEDVIEGQAIPASSPQSKTPRLIAPSQQNPLVDLPKPPRPISPASTSCFLPPELLNQIFDSISLNRDFASLALASRRFLHLARSHLYHTIVLDLSDHAEGYYRERKPWEERIRNWFIPPIVRTLSKQPACALHVKTVEVRYRSKVIYDKRGGYREFESFAPTPQVVFDTLEEALRNLSNLDRIYSECTQRFDYESHETLAALLVKYCPKLEILDLPSATFNFASSLSLLTRLPLLKEIRSNLCTDYPIPRSTSTMSSALLHTLRFSRAIGNPRALPWILHLSANTLHTLSIRLQDCDGIRQFKWKHTTKAQPVDLSFLSNLRHLTIHVQASSALPATLKSTLNLLITHLTLIAHDIVLSKVRFLHLLPRQLEHLSIGPSGYMRLLDWSPLLLPSNPCPNLKIVELAGGGNPETCSKTTFDVNSTAEVPIKYGFEVRWIIETLAEDPFEVGNTLRKDARIVKDGPAVHWAEEEDVYAPQRLEGWRITDFAPRKSGQEESFEQRRLRKEPPER